MSEDLDARAGEYVLGLLDHSEAEACAARLTADPAFARAVEHWRARLAEFDLSAPAQAPSATVWARIAATTAGSASAPSPARTTRSESGWRLALAAVWESLAVWRGIGMGAAAAALLLAIGLGFQMRETARAPVLIAVLLSNDNRPAAVVNTFRDGRAELVPLAALRAPEGKALQVWTLWDRARGPVSVGLVDALRSLDLQLKGLPTAVPEQLFEVTLEPAGGSPTGRPTGPILMKGTASRAL